MPRKALGPAPERDRKRRSGAQPIYLMAIIDELKVMGRSLAQIAKELNAKGIKTPHGGEWQATQVGRIIAHFQKRGID